MDKSWIYCDDRSSHTFKKGVAQFLEFAFTNSCEGEKILCPCRICLNCQWLDRETVNFHLHKKGFDLTYRTWVCHGEEDLGDVEYVQENSSPAPDAQNDMEDLLHDVNPFISEEQDNEDMSTDYNSNIEDDTFDQLLNDSQQELYPGCKDFTKLSFTIRLYLMKGVSGWSNSSFDSLMGLLKLAFPLAKIPSSFNKAKKMMKGLGLEYEKIDACRNHCMLFRNEHKDDDFCSVCKSCRWITTEDFVDNSNPQANGNFTLPNGRKIPIKVLRYFPLKPRLQRLYKCSRTASSMRWHEEGRVKDGNLRHPADGEAWKTFDSLHPDFASEPRNVRLGLASDGFNPFRNMNLSYSIWPVILIPYNLPTWMCMKSSYFMLSLLIPGDTSPGNKIDVYLQPLVEELLELWDHGVDTYDASLNSRFCLRATLMFTINDFPAYAMLSGWSTKGKLACPICQYDTCSSYLSNSHKCIYMGHRKFLRKGHKWNRGRSYQSAPIPLSGSESLKILEPFDYVFGVGPQIPNKAYKNKENRIPWKKKSIFFKLPYWETNLLRHNIDVMHVEKNVCDNVLVTILNVPGRSKDHQYVRYDMEAMGIRKELHPVHCADGDFFPTADFTMRPAQKAMFCKSLKSVKVPDGYASNIARCVNVKERRLVGMKSHDSHFLLQNLLGVGVKNTLPKHVASPLIKLGSFFKSLCEKVIRVADLDYLEHEIAEIISELEMIFPPTFFDIMEHLPVHLIREVRLGGPVQNRWMYPIERYLGKLKSMVRNRSRPEGCIAEAYIADECLTFCSRYLNDSVDTRLNRGSRNIVSELAEKCIFPHKGRPLWKAKSFVLDDDTRFKAHRYALYNCKIVNPYLSEHQRSLKKRKGRNHDQDMANKHKQSFAHWFEARIKIESDACEDIRSLSQGPEYLANRFKGYVVNGYRFRNRIRDLGKVTQNSGVAVIASTESYASSRQKEMVVGDVNYYGCVTDIIEIEYVDCCKVVLFRCDWFENKNDEFGQPMVKLKKLIYRNDPFILASQAHQVIFVKDPKLKAWHNVILLSPKESNELVDEENDISTIY